MRNFCAIAAAEEKAARWGIVGDFGRQDARSREVRNMAGRVRDEHNITGAEGKGGAKESYISRWGRQLKLPAGDELGEGEPKIR